MRQQPLWEQGQEQGQACVIALFAYHTQKFFQYFPEIIILSCLPVDIAGGPAQGGQIPFKNSGDFGN